MADLLQQQNLNSDIGLAAQTHDMVASGGLISGTVDFVSKTLPLATISALTSLVNIPHDIAEIPYQLFTGDKLEAGKVNYSEVLAKLDNSLNLGAEDYYAAHKTGIDALGFAAAALVPGTLGIKAMRLGLSTTAAAGLAETGMVGRVVGLGGLFEGLGQGAINAAKLEIANGSAFSYLSKTALNAAASGAAVGVVEALAFNTAATLALHTSPYLNDKSAGALAKDAITDSLLFGAVGGALLGSITKDGLGLLGLRSTVKSATERANILGREATDLTGAAETLAAGTKFKTLSKTGREVEQEITHGDVAVMLKDKLQTIKTFTEDSAAIEANLAARNLLSSNPVLKEAELSRFAGERKGALDVLQSKLEKNISDLFGNVSDRVNIKQLTRSVVEGSTEDAARLLLGAKNFASVNLEVLTSATGIGKKVIYDLERNTIVDKLSGASVWDLSKNEQAIAVATKGNQHFTPEAIANGSLTGLSGSATYKAAIDKVEKFGTALAASNNYSLSKDTALLDVLVEKAARQGGKELSFKVDGINKTQAELRVALDDHKTELLISAINKGKAPEEIAAMLHIDEAMVSKIPELNLVRDMASTPKARYIIAEYEKLSRSSVVNKFNAEGVMEAKAKAKLALEERTQSLTAQAPEIMSFGNLRVELFNDTGAAGIFKHADSAVGNVFQQNFNALTKLYNKVMVTNASNRVAAVDSVGDAILAGGKNSTAYQELAGITTWIDSVKTRGGGVNLWQDSLSGNTYIVQRDVLIAAKEELKLATANDAKGQVGIGDFLAKSIKPGISPEHTMVQVRTPEVGNYFKVHQQLDMEALGKSNELRRLQGQPSINPGEFAADITPLYMPNPNKAKQPFALVIVGDANHQNPAYAGQTRVVTFKNAAELQAARAKLGQGGEGLNTYTIKDTKEFYQGIEAFDNSLAFNGRGMKQELQNKGILSGTLPGERSVESFLADTREWHMVNDMAITRNQIALKHADEFAVLKALSRSSESARDSSLTGAGTIERLVAKDKPSAAEQVINQLLNIQNKGAVNAVIKIIDHAGNSFLSPAMDAVKRAFTKNEILDTDKLTKIYADLGIEQSYQKAIYTAMDKRIGESSAFDKSVRFSNMVLATGQLRMDGFNTIINAIGSPILGSSTVGLALKQIRSGLAKEDVAAFNATLGVNEVGFFNNTVNFAKLAHNSAGRESIKAKDTILKGFSQGEETISQLYSRLGITQSNAETIRQESQQAMLDLIHSGKPMDEGAKSIFTKTINFLSTPSDFVEGKLQFIAADAGLQIATAAKLSPQDTLSLMNTITQKLQGNYTAAQKPQLFQGTVGAAIGLFQSYQARLVHRILDVVDSGDKRMLGEMAALQSGIFGVKSLPGFDQINTYLVAKNNEDKQDIYSSVFGATNRAAAGALLYGVSSAVLSSNLSTRGAIDFRAPSKITEIPAVNIWTGLVKQAGDFINNASKGDVGASFNQALQHNVFNRPVQQMAILYAGHATTSNGKEAVDINDPKFRHPEAWLPYSLTQTMRALGARPLDEAVYLDTVYRFNNYRLADKENTTKLGEALVTTLRAGKEPDEEQMKSFKQDFVASGGTLEGYKRWYKNQISNSSLDAGQRLSKLIKNSGEARQLSIMLGGKIDYSPEANLDTAANVK